jgi:Ankyrin repeats (3 copies)
MDELDLLLSQFRSMAMFENYEINSPESHGMDDDTPLHVIALDGNYSLLKKILPFVSEIDVVGDCGNTPLHYAVNWNRPDIARVLVENGANPMRPNDYGDIPLFMMRGKSEFQEIYRAIEENIKKQGSSP